MNKTTLIHGHHAAPSKAAANIKQCLSRFPVRAKKTPIRGQDAAPMDPLGLPQISMLANIQGTDLRRWVFFSQRLTHSMSSPNLEIWGKGV